ncbi:MAG TPA: type II CAAX endopeptidase family protein [Bacteroidales bacterium]|nr:type II CAAX endopeptidase family protein [Bacteroidales bacterium]HPF03974.1 type II CAAX endopeptidase family protein [Bacteroidales bacterium]HPJ59918.1 type II CAAX endopeptidase family protein [Bacteroidales bacterium]HPR12306.1 type II CAAX endopeptidase family protein [Bacteroidales bacterium]HRW83842.1 type II CAAX endopeptidase family protein [Bacteroidales bacterium]
MILLNALNVDLSLKVGNAETIIPLALATSGFIIYWFTALSGKIKDRFYARYENDRASVNYFIFTRIFGFMFLGAIPITICLATLKDYPLSYYGLSFRTDTLLLTLISTAALGLIVFPLALISARKPKNLANYPMIRARVWTPETVMITIAGWAIYLFGYELLFRGILLMPLADNIGVWPAILVNVAFYSATHVPKGLEETVGAIPLGLVLCIITLATGTIWTAFLVHLIMAVTNCLTAMKYHPEIEYLRKKK